MDNMEHVPKTKILFVIGSLVMGGIEVLLLDILNNIDFNKYDVTLLAIYGDGDLTAAVPEEVHFKYIFKHNFKGSFRIIRRIPSRILYRCTIKERFDIEISFKTGIAERLITASPNLLSHKIAFVHEDYEYKKCSLKKQRKYYEKVNKIITVSEKCKRAFNKVINADRQVEVIYNAVSTKKINSLRSEKCDIEKCHDETVIVSVGRLVYEKGYDRIIEMLGRIREKNIKLYIVGEGPERKNLERKIQQNRLDGRVHLVGNQINPYKYLKIADVYFQPSRTEAFGIAIVEALIMGLPVISTKSGGPEEILENGKYGLLVENNETGILSGLEFIADSKEKLDHYRQLSLLRSMDFTIDRYMSDLYEVFK